MGQDKATEGSILIAHMADTHLRDTQYATAKRGLDFEAAFLQAVEKSCAAADIVVLVGDIFDKPRPSARVIGQLLKADMLARHAGKIILAVTGNHDWCAPTWLSTLFPEGASRTSGIVPLDDDVFEFEGFVFAGVQPHNHTGFREKITDVTKRARGADVVLYHGLVTGVVPMYGGLKDPLRVDELPVAKENKAWLLGDIHITGYVTVDRPGGGKCLIGYPGSTEMCTAAEPTEKVVPLIRLSKDAATKDGHIALDTRRFIRATVRTDEDLDNLMRDVADDADSHPVVVVDFARSVPQTVNRLHSTLDVQRSVVRCYPLPSDAAVAPREGSSDAGTEQLSVDFFVSRALSDDPDLESVGLDLVARGDTDAANIVSEMIEKRLAAAGVREEEF